MDTLLIDTSSQIAAVAYDAVAGALYIEFRAHAGMRVAYRYADAQASWMDTMREKAAAGESVGKFFAASVKPFYPKGSPAYTALTQDEIAAIFPVMAEQVPL